MKQFFDMPLGANYVGENKCEFTVWAPYADKVAVRIMDPDSRTVPLEKKQNGYHTGLIESIPPGTLYFYRLYPSTGMKTNDEEFEDLSDPASVSQPEGVHGPSQVVSHSFEWHDTSWRGIDLSQYIISEIHAGTFTSKGTFDAIIPHLKELKQTGFTAIELMPVAQFPGHRNWGYDGVYPFAVQNSYGGIEGMKRLIDACHAEGLAVVLDVVYNHLGPEGNYLSKYGPYFTDFYNTPWGEAINFDGSGSDHVRRFFIQNTIYWISQFHIDALRLDAVHSIYDFSAFPFLEELSLAVHRISEKLNRKIYCIAESALNDTRLIRSRKLGGLNLHAQWNDDFHHCLHVMLTGESSGYYIDFNGLKDFAKAWEEGYVYSGQYSPFRGCRHGNSSRNVPARRFVVFSQNHDQVGNRMLGERLSELVSFEKLKLAAGLVLFSPFIPLLFMGDEYGETAPFLYFVDHSDPDLVEGVRKGRAKEFEEFKWKSDPPDPLDEATFQRSKLKHELKKSGRHKILLDFHQKLMELRKKIAALSIPSKKNMKVNHYDHEQILFVRRYSSKDEIFGIFRFGKEPQEASLPIPTGRWEKVFDSWEQKWQGPGSDFPLVMELVEDQFFNIPPDGLVVYYRKISSFNIK
jgi:maltooligosyltrehalose trehalohydrolase